MRNLKARTLLWLIFALMTVGIAAAWRLAVPNPGGTFDDAFILLVYARHFADTGQFFYQPADGHLDGFTSLLDLLLKGGLIRLFPGDPIFVVWAVTVALFLAIAATAAALAALFARSSAGSRRGLILLFALLAATSNSVGVGSRFLLETPLYVLICLALVGRFVAWRLPATRGELLCFTLLLCALPLARPEGLPLAVGILAAFLLGQRHRLSLLELAGPVGLFLVGMALYYRWRLGYFGAWAPNTYYAKSSSQRLNELRDGVQYVATYSTGLGLAAMAWLLCAPLWLRRLPTPELRWRGAAVQLLALLAVATVVLSGGDCYGGGRLLAAPIALSWLTLLLAVTAPLPAPQQRGPRRFLVAMLALQLAELIAIPAYVLATDPRLLVRTLREEWPLSIDSFACDREIAAQLKQVAASDVVGQTDYQRLKFFADELTVLDLTGLNDRSIAHKSEPLPVRWGKFSYARTLARAPELLVLGHEVRPSAQPMSSWSLEGLAADPQRSAAFIGYPIEPAWTGALARRYVTASLRACGGYFNLFVRRDRAESIHGRSRDLLIGKADSR